MQFLYPVFNWRLLPRMLVIAGLGALTAGIYGIIHDQVTFSISEEYFTRLKFQQFAYAEMGLPVRGFVGQIGFLATWWVGLFAGWLMARMTVPVWPFRKALRSCGKGFAIMISIALASGVAGYALGLLRPPDAAFWEGNFGELGITDMTAFARVGIIHNASYLGGLAGLLCALTWLWGEKRKERASA